MANGCSKVVCELCQNTFVPIGYTYCVSCRRDIDRDVDKEDTLRIASIVLGRVLNNK